MGLSVLAVGLRWTRVDAGECRHDLGRRNGDIVRVQVDREERRHRWIPMEQAVPDATGHGQSKLFVVHAQTARDAVTPTTRAAALSPALKNPSSNAPGEPEAQN